MNRGYGSNGGHAAYNAACGRHILLQQEGWHLRVVCCGLIGLSKLHCSQLLECLLLVLNRDDGLHILHR